jgi:hypothetical protein
VGAVTAHVDGLVQSVSIHHPRHHAQHEAGCART